jgi:signal transduction histidine kinase/integral membrane sensor domain MASE1
MFIASQLKAPDSPIHVLWPPNAFLMAAFILSPRRRWPLYLAVLLPVHLAVQLGQGLPLAASLGWFVGNTGEALLGAWLLRTEGGTLSPFQTVRGAIRFVVYCALLAPAISSFWDAGSVVLTGVGSGYWNLYSVRLLSDAIAILLFVPPIVMAFGGGVRRLIEFPADRKIEVAALAASAVIVSIGIDVAPVSLPVPFHVYALLPIFLWSALRFGPWESSIAILAVTLSETWMAGHGRGPLASISPASENVLFLQVYAALIAVPLLLFAIGLVERGRVEQLLRRNEQRLQLAFDISRLAQWDWDLKTGEISGSECSPEYRAVLLDPDVPPLFGFMHPDDRAEVERRHHEAIRECGSYEVEFRVVDESGGTRWRLMRAQVIGDESGRPVRICGVSQDITARKSNEEALTEAQNMGALARKAGKVAIWSFDVPTGKVHIEGPSLLGLERSGGVVRDVTGAEAWLNRIYEADRGRLNELWSRLTSDAMPMDRTRDDTATETPIPELEYRFRHADGTLRWFLTRGTVIRNRDGAARRIVGTAIDVTERKKAELERQEQRRELTHLARVSAVGALSGAIAHELKQPLTAILSNAQAAKRLIERGSVELREVGLILDDIVAEDQRAGEVIGHLRRLLKNEPGVVQSVDLSAVVHESLQLVHGDLVTRNVMLVTSLPEGLPPVQADPVQLQQVLLNLILNACDAMNDRRHDDRTLTVTASRKGSTVAVAVSDSGPGVPARDMDSLFQAFFTTKSSGLGLGLAICKSIIDSAGGSISLENNSDRGATVRFALPCAAA